MLPDCNSYANIRMDYVDRSSNFLHAIPVKHDPYTPDSMDSPNALIAVGEVPDLDTDHIDISDNMSVLRSVQLSNTTRHIGGAVSPTLLKSKLELIVRNKKHNNADMEKDASDIKRSPSDCYLRFSSDTEDRHWCVRKNRCNSDVSWQRSHVLTEAWIQGKGQQGYHSFSSFANRSSSNSSPPDVNGLPSDWIIPRIAIINASNFESNESSDYFHDDRLSNYSENKLSAYSDGRTKTLSGEAVSSEKSDEICDKLDEKKRLSSSIGELDIRGNAYTDDYSTSILNQELYFKEDNIKYLAEHTSCITNNAVSDKKYAKSTIEQDVLDKSCFKDKNATSVILLDCQPSSQAQSDLNYDEIHKTLDTTNIEINSLSHSTETEFLIDQEYDSNVISVFPHIQITDDVEIISYENTQKVCTSKNTTRSNSAHSQDISDHAGSVRLKLKAYKVTERCKCNIIRKKTRCRKCCCVVS